MAVSDSLGDDGLYGDPLLEQRMELKATADSHKWHSQALSVESLRQMLYAQLQITKPPQDWAESRAYVGLRQETMLLPLLEGQLELRKRPEPKRTSNACFQLCLYRNTNPCAESKEEMYGFVSIGCRQLTEFTDCLRCLRSVQSVYDQAKPNLLVLHDYYQHPLQLFGLCRKLSANCNVFMPFLQDVYATASRIIYQAPEENFVGYLAAYCRDAIGDSFSTLAHGASCYLAQHLLNTLPMCRKAWFCNNISRIKGVFRENTAARRFINQKSASPDVSIVTDNDTSVVNSVKMITSEDNEESEIQLARHSPRKVNYTVKFFAAPSRGGPDQAMQASFCAKNAKQAESIARLRKADELCRQLVSDREILRLNKKIGHICLPGAKAGLVALRSYYNRLPGLIFLCGAQYQHKFELLPLDSAFARFGEVFLALARKATTSVQQEKEVLCLFSDHGALDTHPIDGYPCYLLCCASHDVFGCCENLIVQLVL